MTHETLCVLWLFLLGLLLTGYAVLDGFDLGVGIMHPILGRSDDERRVILNSIGPIWDGNEVWLVTFGGALFAGVLGDGEAGLGELLTQPPCSGRASAAVWAATGGRPYIVCARFESYRLQQ